MRRLHRKKAAKCRCDNREHNHGAEHAETETAEVRPGEISELSGEENGETEGE